MCVSYHSIDPREEGGVLVVVAITIRLKIALTLAFLVNCHSTTNERTNSFLPLSPSLAESHSLPLSFLFFLDNQPTNPPTNIMCGIIGILLANEDEHVSASMNC